MGKLGVLRPTDVPHATEYVTQMVDMIATLIARDAAYVTDDGVYLSIAAVPDYGLLAHQSVDDMLSGGGDREVFGAENKRHPADFALWKFTKPGEPSWPSPWGEGRPGWHSECVVMSLELLGEGFDLHCGGADLRFPHHENERAQSVALGKTFANHWMHNGFVVDLEGEKMSKSLGNVLNLLDLLDKYDPRAYRMLLLQTHYRSPVRVGQDNIDASVSALAGLDSFAARTSTLTQSSADVDVLHRFADVMDNDLDTPAAMALVFDTVRRANTAFDNGDTATASSLRASIVEVLAALGLELSAGSDIDDDIVAKAAALDAARAAKDFATADAIRNELQDLGYVVETSKEGTRVRRG
jgi:cysteinyl-tRNA synthetase